MLRKHYSRFLRSYLFIRKNYQWCAYFYSTFTVVLILTLLKLFPFALHPSSKFLQRFLPTSLASIASNELIMFLRVAHSRRNYCGVFSITTGGPKKTHSIPSKPASQKYISAQTSILISNIEIHVFEPYTDIC